MVNCYFQKTSYITKYFLPQNIFLAQFICWVTCFSLMHCNSPLGIKKWSIFSKKVLRQWDSQVNFLVYCNFAIFSVVAACKNLYNQHWGDSQYSSREHDVHQRHIRPRDDQVLAPDLSISLHTYLTHSFLISPSLNNFLLECLLPLD